MGAALENKWWKKRSKHGRDKIIESPEVMLEAVEEFFELKNSTYLAKPVMMTGGDLQGKTMNLEFKDYPTLEELSHFLGFKSFQTWYNYKKREDFLEVVTYAEEVIRSWKIKGAAIGLYNHNIVARDIGLSDKQEVKAQISTVEVDWSA